MKAYIVKDKQEKNYYLLYPHYEPYWDKELNKWDNPYKCIKIHKKYISSDIKLPKEKEKVEVDVEIIKNDISKFTKGCKVSYTEFSLMSFLCGGMFSGGYHNYYIAEVHGIDWYNEKILVQKHDDKKPKWYSWDNFEITI